MRDFEVSHPIISLLFSLLKSTYPSARVPRPVHRPPSPRAVPDSGQQVRAFVGWQWGVGTSVVGCEQQAKVELIFRDLLRSIYLRAAESACLQCCCAEVHRLADRACPSQIMAKVERTVCTYSMVRALLLNATDASTDAAVVQPDSRNCCAPW